MSGLVVTKKLLFVSWMASLVGVVGMRLFDPIIAPTNECHRNNFPNQCMNGTGYEIVADPSIFVALWSVATATAMLCFFLLCAIYVGGVDNGD